MVEILTEGEYEYMLAAGKIVAEVLTAMRTAVKPGVSTLELDKLAYDIFLVTTRLLLF